MWPSASGLQSKRVMRYGKGSPLSRQSLRRTLQFSTCKQTHVKRPPDLIFHQHAPYNIIHFILVSVV